MQSRVMPKRDYSKIKTAVAALFGEAGSARFLAKQTGRKRFQVFSEWADKKQLNRFPPIDILADVECLLDRPIVTEALAELSGHVLVPAPDPKSGYSKMSLAVIAKQTSKLTGQAAETLADNKIDPYEAVSLLPTINESLSLLISMKMELEQRAGERDFDE